MIIAVDTGGTKTLVARFSRDGNLEEAIKFPTPRDFKEYVQAATEKVHQLAGDTPVEVLSVAVPGVVENGVVLRCPNIGWENEDIVGSFSALFPSSRIRAGNDADIAAVGEAQHLSSLPRSAIYVTFSTGVGTGMVVNGKLIPELSRFELGHATLEYGGVFQIWENFASGRAIYQHYGQYARDITDPDVWDEIADRMSRGLQILIPTYQPEYIIIGGSMGSYFDNYQAALNRILAERIPKYAAHTQIIQAKYPEEAVIYGCYYHAIDLLTD